MTSAFEIALDVLNAFGPNVVARKPQMSYGKYAELIGRSRAKDGQAVGMALHAIGAVCVVRALPVAPLYWVESERGGEKGVFESDTREREFVIDSGHYDTMYVVAREYHYSAQDFEGVEKALLVALKNPTTWSPHKLWHRTFVSRVTVMAHSPPTLKLRCVAMRSCSQSSRSGAL